MQKVVLCIPPLHVPLVPYLAIIEKISIEWNVSVAAGSSSPWLVNNLVSHLVRARSDVLMFF